MGRLDALRSLPYSHWWASDPVATATSSVTAGLVIRDHESPHQRIQRIVIEGILRRRDAKRNVIDPRKRPRVTNPFGKKSDHGGRFTINRKRRAISERDFHLGRWQGPGELFRNRAIRSVGAEQPISAKLTARFRPNNPTLLFFFESPPCTPFP